MNNYRKRVTLPSLGRVSINFYCISKVIVDLYDKYDEFSRQKKINHLGLISLEIDGASHTRYDYVMLQCALSDVLDKLHKGSSSQGSIKVNKQKFSGNSLLKSWFLLSNFGHLKNTFGDERSLLLYIKKRKGFKSKILKSISSVLLKDWSEKVIDNFEYYNFHYVLAIYRVCKSTRNTDKKDEIMLVLELLLIDVNKQRYSLNKAKLLQLKSLFNKIRDISIVTIDGHYSHTPLSIDLISSLVSFDEIEGGVEGKDISISLKPLKSLLHDEIYLAPMVLANQRTYEVNSLDKMFSLPQNSISYDKIIREAISDGILTDHKRTLYPFCRMYIKDNMQSSGSFYDEFRQITLRVKKNCPNVDAYIDINPYTNIQSVDFFISDKFENIHLPKLLSNISNLIKDQINNLFSHIGNNYNDVLNQVTRLANENNIPEDIINIIISDKYDVVRNKTWEQAKLDLFPTYRDLIWSTLKHFIKSEFRLEIEHSSTSYDNYSFSFPELGDQHLFSTLSDAISQEVDPDRIHEIKMLENASKRKFNGFKIACLVRINILDMTKSPDKMKTTDIDAVLLKISEDSIKLELFEAKNHKRSKEKVAVKDLRALLVPILNKKCLYTVTEVKGFGGKLTISI